VLDRGFTPGQGALVNRHVPQILPLNGNTTAAVHRQIVIVSRDTLSVPFTTAKPLGAFSAPPDVFFGTDKIPSNGIASWHGAGGARLTWAPAARLPVDAARVRSQRG
jgi:hypothetical protein